jgi:[ribosomal protein S5]-alanine N-acetyltransferase
MLCVIKNLIHGQITDVCIYLLIFSTFNFQISNCRLVIADCRLPILIPYFFCYFTSINKKMLELNFSPFPEITTENLSLRRMTAQDVAEILFLRSSGDVMKYIDRPKAISMQDAQSFLDIINNSLEANDGITWGIAMKENPGNLIGTIGYWRIIKEHYRAEIGYMLHPAFWKKGIMKEAISAVLDFGFNIMCLHSIEARINAHNAASAGVLAATGFIKEAHFKEDFFFDGTFRDTVIYSRLK